MSCGLTAQTHTKQRSSHLPKLLLSELLLISPLIAGLLRANPTLPDTPHV